MTELLVVPDKTCCRSYPTPSFLQLLFIVSLVAWGPFKLWGAFRGGTLLTFLS